MNLTDRSDNLSGNDIKHLCLFYVTNVNYSHVLSVLQAICAHFYSSVVVHSAGKHNKSRNSERLLFFHTQTHTHTHTHTGGSVPHRYLIIVLNYHETCLNT